MGGDHGRVAGAEGNLSRFVLRDLLGFGFGLWLWGYALGFVFYAFVPPALIGWFVMPFGLAVTLFVLWKWVRIPDVGRGFYVGLVWAAIAVVLDYVGIVKLLNPPDGYYKLDVYIYYALTLALPIAAGLWARRG